MPADAIVLTHRRSRRRPRLGIPPASSPCSARHDPAPAPDQGLAAPRRSAMVGLSPPEPAAGGCRYGQERLEPFLLDNVTPQIDKEPPWPPRWAPSRRAKRPSFGDFSRAPQKRQNPQKQLRRLFLLFVSFLR